MQRVRLLKSCKFGVKNQVLVIDNNEAIGLIERGEAVITKDMTETDYKITSDEGQADGKHIKLRTNKSK